ncbi:MAG: hypothetical protein Kow0098_05510 [Ignavibacteriaceae bacterium]
MFPCLINTQQIILKLQFVFFCFILFNPVSGIAQSDDNHFRKFLNIGGDIFTSPVHFDKDDWISLSATVSATSLALLADDPLRSFTLDNQTPFLNSIAEIDNYYHIETMLIGVVGLYTYGGIANKSSSKELALKLTEASVYSVLINLGIKFIAGRDRPGYSDKSTFNLFSTAWENTSLPSGHSTLAFAYSTVMAQEYNNFFWKFGWYSLAALVGLARIYHDVHWFSDVILGSAIGYFTAQFVNNHKSNNPDDVILPPDLISLRIAF